MCATLTIDRITDDADWKDEHRLDCGATLAIVELLRQKDRKMHEERIRRCMICDLIVRYAYNR